MKTKKTKLKRLIEKEFTPGQRALAKKHGTPAEFAIGCYMCVPEVSVDEAERAAQEYRKEFLKA